MPPRPCRSQAGHPLGGFGLETAQSFSQNPSVFLVGCHRSGTTLLKRIVNNHPQIAIAPETHWILLPFEQRQGLTDEGRVTRELIPRLLAHPKFAKMKLGQEKLEKLLAPDESVSYAHFVSGIFDLYGQRRKKPLVGDKTARYVRDISLLHFLWPKARFIHLIRDGRDVCLSMLNWDRVHSLAGRFATWNQDPIATAALWWKWHVQSGREAGGALGAKLYYELRYESLITRPEDACAVLCEFLAVPYDDVMLRFHEGRTRDEPGLNANRAWLPITPGLRDWRTQMPAEDIERFEAAAGDLLDELGYARAVPYPRPETLRPISSIRDSFTYQVLSEGQRLPHRW